MDSNSKENQIVVESLTPQGDDNDTLLAMVLGAYMVFPAVLKAAIELKLFDIIAKETSKNSDYGFVSSHEIASKLPIQQQHLELPNRLERMLGMLVSYSLLKVSTRTNDDGSMEKIYGISSVGKHFVCREENDASFATSTPFMYHHAMMDAWLNFKEAIIDPDGDDLFKKVHGISTYEYFGKDPQLSHIFNKAMTYSGTIQMKRILEVYKGFEGVSTLVDVGGGNGHSLNMIIAKYPSIKAINFDLSQVIENAPPLPGHLGIRHVGGNMFESVPHGDAILIKAVCHNWSDEKCMEILRNCHKALPPNGKVILVELLTLEVPEPTDASRMISITDSIMFLTAGGKERTKQQYESLAKHSGFSRFQIVCRAFSIIAVMELHK